MPRISAGLSERGTGGACRSPRDTPLPEDLRAAILAALRSALRSVWAGSRRLAVRSSATAEDLPEASFAGAAETFLNVRGREGLLRAVHACYSSLFTDRAISYRARLGYDQLKVALSVGVMPMVRSDKASSGVIFTLDTESGFRDVVTVSGAYGLGEFVVQGVVTPDEWTVFKPTLATGHRAIIGRRLGTKEVRLVYADGSKGTRSEPTPAERARAVLSDGRRRADAGPVGLPDRGALLGARRAPAADGHRMGEGRRDRRAVHRAGASRDRPFGEAADGGGGDVPADADARRPPC